MKEGKSKYSVDAEQEHVSSTDAMDEYFFDMLGSVADQQPLKKYGEDVPSSSLDDRDQLFGTPQNDHKASSSSSPKRKPKTKVIAKAEFTSSESAKPVYAEPGRARISPLIIPAAFPKLAPVKSEPELDVNAKVVEALKTKQKTISKNAAKLDRKTALAILEKKKSKLSAEQLTRLEEKLGIKSTSVSDNKTLTQTPSKNTSKSVEKVGEQNVAPTLSEQNTSVAKASTQLKAGDQEKLVQKTASTEIHHEKKSALISPGEPGQIGPPVWAQDRFECLLFSVAGLKLAVPLVSLGAIYKIESELTPIVGRADYFMGLYRHLDRNVRVLDTAKWVMPDRWTEEARDGYHFIIRLGGNNWGLACDSVHESIQLNTDMVKWRSERTTRAWLSGTVIGHMCALIDADVLSLMLEEKASAQGTSFY